MKNLLLAAFSLFAVACKPPSDAIDTAASELPETRHLSAAEYDGFIATPKKLAAVMFHADWCGPCKKQGPVVEEIVAEFGAQVVFGMVNVDDCGELAKSLGVNGIPDLRLFRNGVMVDAMTGAISKAQIRSRMDIQVAQLETVEKSLPESAQVKPAIRPMSKEWRLSGMERK